MIRAGSGQPFTAIVENGTPGLVGQITFELVDDDGVPIIDETTVGIIEIVPGVYARTQDAPTGGASIAVIVWDDHEPAGDERTATEELRVYYGEGIVPGKGVLPFRRSGGQILDRSDTVLMVVDYDAWRETSNASAGGEIGRWSGVCQRIAAPLLVGKANRFLLSVEGIKFRVEDAIDHDLLSYVELTLLDPRAQG